MLWRTFILSHHLLDFCLCVGDWIDQFCCSADQLQGLFASFSVDSLKETTMWELSSIPGWALCSSYEEAGIWLSQIWAICFSAHALWSKAKTLFICCENYFFMAARERDTKELWDQLTLCGREQSTIPAAPQVYELSPSLILSIFFF